MARLLGDPDNYYGFDIDNTRLQRITHSARTIAKLLPPPKVALESVDEANSPIQDFIKQLLNMTPRHPSNPDGCIEGRFIDRRQTGLYGGTRPLITTTLDAERQRIVVDSRNADYANGFRFTHSISVSPAARNTTRHTIREELLVPGRKPQLAPLGDFPPAEQLMVLKATGRALGILVMGLRSNDDKIEFNIDRLQIERRAAERTDVPIDFPRI